MSSVIEKSFEIISPIDGSVYAALEYAKSNEITNTLSAADSATKVWQQYKLTQRVEIIKRFLAIFEANQDQIALEIAWQMGRPVHQALGEVRGVIERTQSLCHCADEALSDYHLPEKKGFKRYIRKSALGTILVIAPWNYPYLTAINTIIPALLSGNTVILKHAKQTAKCADRLALCFKESGLPTGVFHALHLTHQDTEKLMRNENISGISFTGSVAVGRHLQKKLADRFIPLGLELGGKDAAYVRSDADIDTTVHSLIDGALFNSGQSCCGIERIYVAENRFDEFIEKYARGVNQYVLGNPLNAETTLGPVVSCYAARQIKKMISDAIAAGAHPLISNSCFPKDTGQDAYLAPQVLVDVDHSMKFMTEEHFGPAVGIMPVLDDAQAIALMNDSPYGLTGSVWTSDVEAAQAIGEQVQVGTWFMNRCDYLDPELPWIGVKESGRGLTLSRFGYDQVTQRKSFHLKLSSGVL